MNRHKESKWYKYKSHDPYGIPFLLADSENKTEQTGKGIHGAMLSEDKNNNTSEA